MHNEDINPTPQDGLRGLKENFSSDFSAGFVVFLLAMPLSLGIAKASEFPAIMGLLTAIIGGVLVSFFAGSRLTIKGPAAGLIVIVAGSVADFGGGVEGWKLALGAMVVSGVIQIAFGLFKLGRFADIFPLSAVHGMLAAIGLIIIFKQIPVLLNVDPTMAQGKSIMGLIALVPDFIWNMDPEAGMIGILSLLIMLGWPYLKKGKLRVIPSPLVVLLIAIPIQLYFDFRTTEASYSLLKVGDVVSNLDIHAEFGGLEKPSVFIRYVVMFALVGSLESLLTVKAVDQLDPYKRKSDNNKDLVAIGIGNTFTAFLGGLPMISEVARSSANVSNGAKTRWANFYHGLFILGFIVLATPVIEMIPNASLAAMLIAVGIKLAHPKEFIQTYKVGPEQLIIFVTTIVVTLIQDLLVGIAAGVLMKVIIHSYHGVKLSSFLKPKYEIKKSANEFLVTVNSSLVFSNFLGLRKKLEELEEGSRITVELSNCNLVDHSVMEAMHQFARDYRQTGGVVSFVGLDGHKPFSQHPLAGRKKVSS